MTAACCALCRTAGGDMGGNTHRPTRTDTTRHGLPGACCHACAATVRYRHRHGIDPRTGPTPKEVLPVDDRILAALKARPEGLTLAGLNHAVQPQPTVDELTAGLAALLSAGRIWSHLLTTHRGTTATLYFVPCPVEVRRERSRA